MRYEVVTASITEICVLEYNAVYSGGYVWTFQSNLLVEIGFL
jgi:hypothetical protein